MRSWSCVVERPAGGRMGSKAAHARMLGSDKWELGEPAYWSRDYEYWKIEEIEVLE